jgi:hypothetical protein
MLKRRKNVFIHQKIQINQKLLFFPLCIFFYFVCLDYIDPYLRMAEHANLTFWGDYPQLSKRDITGFRSVLKLTQSYPRNPEYAYATLN